DLDDVGAEVAEERRAPGARRLVGEVADADAFQGTPAGGRLHGAELTWPRPDRQPDASGDHQLQRPECAFERIQAQPEDLEGEHAVSDRFSGDAWFVVDQIPTP